MRSGAFLQTLLACHQSSDAHCSSERESPRCSREEGKSWREAGRLALLEGLSGDPRAARATRAGKWPSGALPLCGSQAHPLATLQLTF